MVKKVCKEYSSERASSTSAASGPPMANIKRKPHNNYQFIDISKRVDVIYDNFVHDQQPIDISNVRGLKYNTVRSILQNFYQNGRINVKKKMSGYTKGQKIDKQLESNVTVTHQNLPKQKGRNRRKTVRPYRRVFAQNKLIGQQTKDSQNIQEIKEMPEQSEKHSNFVSLGPQTIDLQNHQSNCNLGLFVAQDEDTELGLKTDELAVFKSKQGLYPFNIYDIEQGDIDKQECKKGDLDALFHKLLRNMGISELDEQKGRSTSKSKNDAPNSNILFMDLMQKRNREQEVHTQNLRLLQSLNQAKPMSKESSEEGSQLNDGTLSSVSQLD